MPTERKIVVCGQELILTPDATAEDIAQVTKRICPPGSDDAPEAAPSETPRPGLGLESAEAIKPAPRTLASFLRDVWKKTTDPNPGFRAATGATPEEIEELSAALASTTNEGERPDRIQHKIASNRAARRIGVVPTLAAGLGWEVLGGAASKMRGEPFLNDSTGYDPEDLRANAEGVAGQGVPANIDELFSKLQNDEDILPLLIEAAKRKKAAKR